MKESNGTKRVLSGVPDSLPALIKAHRIQDKVRAVGFDWAEKEEVWGKVDEEIQEVRKELKDGVKEDIESEFGDLLFSIVNAARLFDIEPETALERSNKKFMKRFSYIEERSRARGNNIKQMSLEEMDLLWEEAKTKEN
jgi:XTP/dITP diphosphohydrolase